MENVVEYCPGGLFVKVIFKRKLTMLFGFNMIFVLRESICITILKKPKKS